MSLLNKKHNDKFAISEPTLSCNYANMLWTCATEFQVKNKTHENLTGSLAIRTISMVNRYRSSSVLISDVTKVEYNLNGYQEKTFFAQLKTRKKPDSINITVTDAIRF